MMSGKQGWTVTLDGTRAAADVVAALRKTGFTGVQVLEAIGVVTGTAERPAAGRARQLKGVADVAEDMAVNIGPPGADPS